MSYYRTLCRLCLVPLLLLLAACEIEGGVPPPATPGAIGQSTPTSAGPAPTAVPRETGFRIGQLDAPRDLLPYHVDASDQRVTAPISELLFPEPLLPLSYSYTNTGVLERLPSLENGDIVQQPVEVYLDAAGSITTTVTEVVTQVEQLVVTYRWNPDLRWADDTPVTADDSLFAYELAQQNVLGAEATSRLQLIDRYEQVDEHTTRAFLKPDYITPFAFTTFWTPLPRHLLGEIPVESLSESEFAQQPIGYGPYVVERRDEDSLRLRRNPNYFGEPPMAETVTFVFLPSTDALRSSVLSASLDVAVLDRVPPDQFEFLERDQDAENLRVTYTPGPIWEHLDFNLDESLFQDIRVRRAIAVGTDRQGMVDALFNGQVPVLDSWVVPTQPVSAPEDQLTQYGYNSDEANALLDQAGFVDTDGDAVREREGEPLTIELLTTEETPLRAAVAERFQADMGAIGIQVNIRTLPVSDLYSPEGPLFRREFQLAQFAWIASPDPSGLALWSCTAVPSETNGWAGNNFAGWCFREADRALRTANTSLDPEERRTAYRRQQELFTQELPVLPLFQRPIVTLSNPGIEGIQSDPTAPITWNLATWSRE